MIGGYVVQEEFKRSKRSLVVKAYEENTDKFWVLKTYLGQDTKDSFPNLDLLKTMSHPNLRTVISERVGDEGLVFTMKYIDGYDIDRQLKQGVSADLFRQIISDVCDGLSALHAQRLVHGDISPSNILIDQALNTTIIDLEGAIKFGERPYNRGEGYVTGTPEYISPEKITNQILDNRADIYSFGCLVFKILTGKSPFSEVTETEIGNRHLSHSVPRLPMHLAAFQSAIDSCLAKNPNDRPRTIDSLKGELLSIDIDSRFEHGLIKSSRITTREIKSIQADEFLLSREMARNDLRGRISGDRRSFRLPLIFSILIFCVSAVLITALLSPDTLMKVRDVVRLGDDSELQARWSAAQSLHQDLNQSPISIIAGYRRVLEIDDSHQGALTAISSLATQWETEIRVALSQGELTRAQSKLSESIIALPDEEVWSYLKDDIQNHRHVLRLLGSTRKLLEVHGLSDIPTATLAIQAYQEVLRVAPGYSVATEELNNLARHYADLATSAAEDGRVDEAINYLERAITANSNLPQLTKVRENIRQATTLQAAIQELLKLASAYRETGSIVSPAGANAAELYHRVLAADPSNKIANEALSQIVSELLVRIKAFLVAGALQDATSIVEQSVAAGLDSTVVNKMKASVEEEIARRDHVAYLLDKAEELFSKRYITEPVEGNVIAISREIERIDPGNIQAARLLERSSTILVEVAEDAYKFNMREDAEYYLNLALTIMPDSESGEILNNKLRKNL